MKLLLLSFSISLLILSCGKTSFDDGEGILLSEKVIAKPISRELESSQSKNQVEFVDLDYKNTDYLDIRGFGDTGWSRSNQSYPLAPELGYFMDDFDPTSLSYKGDVTFMNFESVVSDHCIQFKSKYIKGRMYSFVSHPDNVIAAIKRGVNLINLTTNHTRDCYMNDEFGEGKGSGWASELMNISSMRKIEKDYKNFTWHGLSLKKADRLRPKILKIKKGAKVYRIAFNAIYSSKIRTKYSNTSVDANQILRGLKNADADLRFLSIHSQGQSGLDRLNEIGVNFIENFNGDIVFGHGSHKGEPIRVIKKFKNGKGKGILFEGFGNFLHPHLASRKDNYIGRVLFNPKNLRPVQVQVIPISNYGGRESSYVRFSPRSGKIFPANLKWIEAKNIYVDKDRLNVVYSNLKE